MRINKMGLYTTRYRGDAGPIPSKDQSGETHHAIL